MVKIDPSDSVPIWKQIEEGVRFQIASGALGPNDPVSSVREMARELRVNPLTVSKAYRRLVDLEVLIVKRGEGTFVAPNPPRLGTEHRERKLGEAAGRYTTYARTLGASGVETMDAVRNSWQNLTGEEPEGHGAQEDRAQENGDQDD